MKTLAILALCVALVAAQAKIWAVCVAGSNGWYNYRHQSDICHCYQIFHMNGVPDENIIIMMYDDIANNPSNPKKGQIINWPGGPDVYHGVPKDYVGNTVTAANFLKILKGEDPGVGSHKTLKSNAGDTVFVGYSDHGSPGLVAFPVGGYLYARDLMPVLKSMSDKKQYKKFAFYIEACESGSMFNKILDPAWHIYGVTASDPSESSYACDYDSTVKAYLNDCFSVSWLLDARTHTTDPKYTMDQEFQAVKRNTTQSHVCRYGDVSYINDPIVNFFGTHKSVEGPAKHDPRGVPTDMATLKTIENMMKTASGAARLKLEADHAREMYLKKRADGVFGELRMEFPSQAAVRGNDVCATSSVDFECIRESVEAYLSECFPHDDYAYRAFRHFDSFCRAGVNTKNLKTALHNICAKYA